MRRQLAALGPGESKAFPDSFSGAQLRLVHLIARELDYWVETPRSGSDSCMEVFNLADFALSVRRCLSALGAKEQHDFQAQMSEQQHRLIHSIANELDLVSAAVGEGIAVAQLQDFREEVRRMMKRLQPGQCR